MADENSKTENKTKNKSKNKLNYEDMIGRLDDIMNKMENPETPLDESLKLYKEGVDLCVSCADMLKNVRQEVVILHKKGNEVFEQNFKESL